MAQVALKLIKHYGWKALSLHNIKLVVKALDYMIADEKLVIFSLLNDWYTVSILFLFRRHTSNEKVDFLSVGWSFHLANVTLIGGENESTTAVRAAIAGLWTGTWRLRRDRSRRWIWKLPDRSGCWRCCFQSSLSGKVSEIWFFFLIFIGQEEGQFSAVFPLSWCRRLLDKTMSQRDPFVEKFAIGGYESCFTQRCIDFVGRINCESGCNQQAGLCRWLPQRPMVIRS